MRIWKDILGYEGFYKISSDGLVKSVKRDKVLKSHVDTRGYLSLTLHKDGSRKRASIHRLLAEAFIPNKNNYPVINHINGVKTDNRLENIEWCTVQMNSQHAYDHHLKDVANNKPVVAENLDTKELLYFISTRSAGRHFKTSGVCIGNWIRGVRPKSRYAMSFKFSFCEKSNDISFIY